MCYEFHWQIIKKHNSKYRFMTPLWPIQACRLESPFIWICSTSKTFKWINILRLQDSSIMQNLIQDSFEVNQGILKWKAKKFLGALIWPYCAKFCIWWLSQVYIALCLSLLKVRVSTIQKPLQRFQWPLQVMSKHPIQNSDAERVLLYTHKSSSANHKSTVKANRAVVT